MTISITYDQNPVEYTKNVQIVNNQPTVSPSGITNETFSIQPLLPDGLSFNNSTGVISGTPTQESVSQEYSIDLNTNWEKNGTDIVGDPGTNSGKSVSLSDTGTIVAIGTTLADGNGTNSGQVRVYEYDGSTWNKIGQDINGEREGDKSGESVSLSGDGKTVAIGALSNNENGAAGIFTGHVRVYEYDESSSIWNQIGQDIDGVTWYSYFGRSVSLSTNGRIIAIGADGIQNLFPNTPLPGQVCVYEYDEPSSTWILLDQPIVGADPNDKFGCSASLNGDGTIVAIGAYQHDSYRGHVRVYKYDGSTWNKIGQDIDGENENDKFGCSVSLSENGSIVAIGAEYNDGNGNNSGRVQVYEYNESSSTWTQNGQDIDGEAPDDYSGGAVSLSSDGQRLAIGADGNDENGTNAGHVRVYEYDGSSWNQLGIDIDGDEEYDESGATVSLSGDGTSVAIGACNNSIANGQAGQVRVYSRIDVEYKLQLGVSAAQTQNGSSVGDPYITTINGKQYKLPNISGNIRLFDNMNKSHRVVINASIWQLPKAIYNKAVKELNADIDFKATYFKEVYIHEDGTPPIVYDLERMKLLSKNIASNRGELKSYDGMNVYQNEKYSAIEFKIAGLAIELQRFMNPQIRTGINIRGSNLNNGCGALVDKYPIKRLMLKRLDNIDELHVDSKQNISNKGIVVEKFDNEAVTFYKY